MLSLSPALGGAGADSPTVWQQGFAAPNVGSATPASASPSVDPKPHSDPITDDVRDLPARVMAGGTAWDHFGGAVVAIGDVNRDGAGDLAVISRSPWAINLELGSSAGFGTITQVPLQPTTPGDVYGAVAGGSDLNGDGYSDFAVTVGRPDATGQLAYEVDVFYGGPAITPMLAHRTITAPWMERTFGAGLAALRDANGDEFGDLLITASPAAGSTETGAAWIFAGGGGGLGTSFAWNYTYAGSALAFGAAAFSSGDMNGDGLSDFVISTGGQAAADGYARAFVYYGAGAWNIQAPTTLTGRQPQDGFGESAAAGDFDGDGKVDLLLGAPQFDTTPEQADAGRMYILPGSQGGLSLTSAYVRDGPAGSRFAATIASVGDLNGDGVDDAAVGAPLASADGPITNGQMFVFFGGPIGLSYHYDLTEAGEAGNDLYGVSIAGRVDLNGDGRLDLAVGASGRDLNGYTDSGAAYLYSGARLRLPSLAASSLLLPDLTDGKALARFSTPYHLVLSFVYRGAADSLHAADIVLLSKALDGRFGVHFEASSGSITSDAPEYLELGSDSSFAPGSDLLHSYRFTASLKFAWAFADPDPISLELSVSDASGSSVAASVASAFPVVASLAFSLQPAVNRGDGSPVGDGEYVRAGDTLAWSGGHLVYMGTQVVPPVPEVRVEVVNDAGQASPASFDENGNFSVAKAVKPTDDPADLHTVRALSPGGAVLAEVAVLVRVDGTPVVFGAATPGDGATVTQATFPVSILIGDTGSGVDGASVQWSESHSSPPVFTYWQSADAASGSKVTARAEVSLIDNAFNFVRFRATDTVGNPVAYSTPIQLNLDYGAVDFSMVSPAAGSWQRSHDNTITFEVSKPDSPLLDLSSLEYAVSPTFGWTPVGLTGESDAARFALSLALPDGAHNEVRLRVRFAGHPDYYESPAFTVQVDTQAPSIELSGPAVGSWATEGFAQSVVRITDETSGVARETIRYRYLVEGAYSWSSWLPPDLSPAVGGWVATGRVPVNDGVENFVVWQAADLAQNDPATGPYQRLLADSRSVTFERPLPSAGSTQASVSRLSIDVTDGDGSGVDLSTLEFRVDLPGGGTTGWVSAHRDGVATRATVTVPYALPLGSSTVTWRAQDAARTPVGVSQPVLIQVQAPEPFNAPPHLVLRSPTPNGHYRAGVDIKFDAAGSFDPEGQPLYFTWSIDGKPRAERGASLWVQLPPGPHTVTVVLSDGAMSQDTTIAFTVDAPVSAHGPLSTVFEQALAGSFGALMLSALLVRVWARRARRALSSRP